MQDSKFTKNGNGSGASLGVKNMKGGGGTIQRSFPPNTSHGLEIENATGGGKFGGSPTNLEHSLRGTSAVQK